MGTWSKRTHLCGELRQNNTSETVTLNGWVQSIRNHGGVSFVDLRDYTGITQVVFKPQVDAELAERAGNLHGEYVISVTGKVIDREGGNINKKIPTGEIEIVVNSMELLNSSKPLPFELEDAERVDESLRLKHRYIDLRRDAMQNIIRTRHKAIKAMRSYLDDQDFCEIETPIMYKSTPEGAREFLVPSRVHEGHFYALPQSPQIFKQLLMVSGFDKYYQVARCFRDEDARADRQPEFAQLDIEMSFISEEDIYTHMEAVISRIWKTVLDIDVPLPFPRLSYTEAMAKYGSDKPDMRFALEMTEISDLVANVEFGVFANTVKSGGMVKGLCVKEGVSKFSRKAIDKLVKFVGEHGAKGLAWFKVVDGALESGIAKFFNADDQANIMKAFGAVDGDLILIVADTAKVTNVALAALRSHIAEKLEMYDSATYCFHWIVDMPQFVYSEEEERWVAGHHPFVMPKNPEQLTGDPEQVLACAYDLVINGFEVAGGSIRIHDQDVQAQMFKILKISKEDQQRLFGFLLDALQYGAPPHGGIAMGIDRIVMLLCSVSSLRETFAFPKTSKATCPLTGAPSFVTDEQLKDLHIKLDLPAKETTL